jgi:hypothetical protein
MTNRHGACGSVFALNYSFSWSPLNNMSERIAASTRYGRRALKISSVCLTLWVLVALSNGFLGAFATVVYLGPFAFVGDLVALYYALKALDSGRDEKGKAWLAILFASPTILGIIMVFVALSGGLKLYN